MKSQDFFDILHKIGIKANNSEHNNLTQFLCLNLQTFNNVIYMNRLRAAIEDFSENADLRHRAHKYYEELMAEPLDPDTATTPAKTKPETPPERDPREEVKTPESDLS